MPWTVETLNEVVDAGIARALYVTAQRQRVVVLRVFVKKTQKTPNSEIDLALQRMKEVAK